MAGPGLGGLLIDVAGWPWIFFVNVPVAVAVILVARTQLPAGRSLAVPQRVVALQITLFGAAAVALLLGMSLTAAHGPRWLLLALLAVPPLLTWWRTSSGRDVRDLMRIPGMLGPHVALSTQMAAVMLVTFLAPYYLQRVQGVPVAVIGLTLLAMPVAMTVVSPLGGLLADTWGSRRTASTGSVLLTAGLGLLAPLDGGWTPVDVAWRLAVVGAGAGLFAAPNMTMAMSAAPSSRLNTVGATTSLARQLGIVLAPALATTTWALAGDGVTGMRAAAWLAVPLAVVSALSLALARRGHALRRDVYRDDTSMKGTP